MPTYKEISDIFGIARSTIYKYLRQGVKLGWYDGIEHRTIKPVVQMDLAGNIIAHFRSAMEADKCVCGNNNNRGNGICKSCKTHKPYKGFLFRLEDDPNKFDLNFKPYILNTNNTSGVTGVSFDKSRQKWIAHIHVGYKNTKFPRRDNKDDAIRDRLEAELKYYGADKAPQRHLFEQYNINTIQND